MLILGLIRQCFQLMPLRSCAAEGARCPGRGGGFHGAYISLSSSSSVVQVRVQEMQYPIVL